MLEDNTQQVVQPPAASQEGATTTPTTQQPPVPSPEEKMTALIQQKVDEAITRSTELARREIQSVKDKSRAEVEAAIRRAQMAETTMTSARTHLQTVDPEAAKELELSTLRAKEASRTELEKEEEARKQHETYTKSLNDSLVSHLTELGIDPNDKRVDWARDAADFLQGRGRFDASVAKILKEEKQTIQSSFEKRLKELETKVNKTVNETNAEANSVSTTASQGTVASSDIEFMKKFGSGDLEMTKENVTRYNKIKDSY